MIAAVCGDGDVDSTMLDDWSDLGNDTETTDLILINFIGLLFDIAVMCTTKLAFFVDVLFQLAHSTVGVILRTCFTIFIADLLLSILQILTVLNLFQLTSLFFISLFVSLPIHMHIRRIFLLLYPLDGRSPQAESIEIVLDSVALSCHELAYSKR